ncbi:cation-translocating P-type ATPase [bacterium]|nr:cation-translocating P-type ATPase [bacterium]
MSTLSCHARPGADVAADLGVDLARGLDEAEARLRLERDGPNALRVERGTPWWRIAARQFASLVVLVLVGAAALSLALGETIDAAAIAAIVLLNAVIGFLQEYRSERAVAALRRLAAPRARVVRSGAARILAADEVVRGDVLLLDAGDVVAADARLVEAALLRTDEAPLTGESEPVAKSTEPLPGETPVADRANCVMLGTHVVAGSGRAVVFATGAATEMGRIAELISTASPGDTPLAVQLDSIARRLLWASLGIVAVVFAAGLLRGMPPEELFLAAVSLAVAAIPEGLPAVVTVALALGVSRMAARRALVRRLPAVETLGAAEVVCTDKTGTLTAGEMAPRRVVLPDAVFHVAAEAGSRRLRMLPADDARDGAPADAGLRPLAEAAAGCSDAELGGDDSGTGDPTEVALLRLARACGVERPAVERERPRVALLPFDADRKRMTIVRRQGKGAQALVKGAPESMLALCSGVRTARGVVALDVPGRAKMEEAALLLADEAFRVIAIAERDLADDETLDAEHVERDLVLLGLVGLQDPPRPEAREAVARCRRAGVRVVMITGDHPATASAIADELGIRDPGDETVVGSTLDATSDDELARRIRGIAVHARVTPEHKLRIVRAWKRAGAVVAMTGDGVNDAPALEEASIGIAMGRSGTEVAKEAADMVIADDDFSTIVAAVEEGRGIWEAISRALAFLLSGNAAELAVVLVAVLVGWPLPLLPIHMLWINLVTDGLPALALATGPVDPDVLLRPPRRPEASMMDASFVRLVALVGTTVAACTLAGFAWELRRGDGVDHARSAAFAILVLCQMLVALGMRESGRPLSLPRALADARLVAIVGASLAIQAALHQVPALRRVFGTYEASAAEAGAWLALAIVPLVVLESAKAIRRRNLAAAEGGRTGPGPNPGESLLSGRPPGW